MPQKVLVTGAGGRTGRLVVQRLLKRPEHFQPIATVRSKESGAALTSLGLPESQLKVVDLAQPQAELKAALTKALEGCSALIVATSAVPEALPKPADAPPEQRPTFVWKEGQKPEQVDWLAQQAQVDAAKEAGVQQVVIISSMGGTNPNHPLNSIAGGNILQWKRKAEQYLIKSGLKYTIIHPGGLIDEAGGARELVLGVDDELTKGTYRSIPRDDVAEVCIQSLLLPKYANRSFDIVSKPAGEGSPTADFGALIDTLGGKNCDYSINSQL